MISICEYAHYPVGVAIQKHNAHPDHQNRQRCPTNGSYDDLLSCDLLPIILQLYCPLEIRSWEQIILRFLLSFQLVNFNDL